MEFFDDIRENMGTMLSDDQKDDFKRMGEKFYGSIDMDKYKPTPTEEAKDPGEEMVDQEILDRMKYYQLKRAMDSGLQEEDLTEEEYRLWTTFEKKNQCN